MDIDTFHYFIIIDNNIEHLIPINEDLITSTIQTFYSIEYSHPDTLGPKRILYLSLRPIVYHLGELIKKYDSFEELDQAIIEFYKRNNFKKT